MLRFFMKLFRTKLNNYKQSTPVTFIGNVKEILKKPLVVIELTSICNLNCTMCTKDISTRIKKHMEFSLFQKIINDAQKSNIDKFQISFYGESTLYPYLVEAIEYIREKIPHAVISMNTNGTLLTSELTKRVLDAGINSIAISIEGNNKEEYEAIRQGASWDILRENVINLKEMVDKYSYPTKITIMGLHLVDVPIDKELYKKTWGLYCDTLVTRNEDNLNLSNKESIFSKLVPCVQLFDQIVILSSGDITSCVSNWEGECSYGNVKDSNFLDVWHNSTFYKLRFKHLLGLKRKLSLCKDCSIRLSISEEI